MTIAEIYHREIEAVMDRERLRFARFAYAHNGSMITGKIGRPYCDEPNGCEFCAPRERDYDAGPF